MLREALNEKLCMSKPSYIYATWFKLSEFHLLHILGLLFVTF
ncbi:hypothetical protein ALT1000_40127 [Alteromonas macleodii]